MDRDTNHTDPRYTAEGYTLEPHFRLQQINTSFMQIAPACRTNKENKLKTARTSLTSSSRVLDNGHVLG